jgi:hypothetical protein
MVNKLISFLMIFSFVPLSFQVIAIAEDHVFEQYLYDVHCANKAIADDGTVLRTFPEKHTSEIKRQVVITFINLMQRVTNWQSSYLKQQRKQIT